MRSLLIVGLALWSTTAWADNTRTPASRELISFAVRPNLLSIKSERVKFLKLFSKYCQDFLNVLPTNTPKEDEWIEADGKTSDISKVDRLLNSAEYSRKTLKESFSDCVDKTKALLQSMDYADRTNFTKSAEASYLISLAITFNDNRDFEIYAARAGLNSKLLGLDFLGTVRRSLLISAMRIVEER